MLSAKFPVPWCLKVHICISTMRCIYLSVYMDSFRILSVATWKKDGFDTASVCIFECSRTYWITHISCDSLFANAYYPPLSIRNLSLEKRWRHPWPSDTYVCDPLKKFSSVVLLRTERECAWWIFKAKLNHCLVYTNTSIHVHCMCVRHSGSIALYAIAIVHTHRALFVAQHSTAHKRIWLTFRDKQAREPILSVKFATPIHWNCHEFGLSQDFISCLLLPWLCVRERVCAAVQRYAWLCACINMSYTHSSTIRARIERFWQAKCGWNVWMPSVLYCLLELSFVQCWASGRSHLIRFLCVFPSFRFSVSVSFFSIFYSFSAQAHTHTHTVCQSIRQSNYSSFGEHIYFAVGYIFPAECSVKSACSSISIDCVKQSSSVHRTAHVLISVVGLHVDS